MTRDAKTLALSSSRYLDSRLERMGRENLVLPPDLWATEALDAQEFAAHELGRPIDHPKLEA